MTVRKIKSIGDIPYPIDVGTDALSPLLTAGAALGIAGNGTDSAAWLQRVSTTDGPTTVKSIHGRTLKWNQLCENGNFAESSGWSAVSSGTHIAIANGELTFTYSGQDHGIVGAASRIIDLVANHKYCLRLLAKGTGDHTAIGASLNSSSVDVNTVFNLTVVQSGYTEYSGIVTYATPSSGTARVRISTANTFTANDTVVIKNVQLFDLTAMFGAGSEPSTIEEFTALYPLPYYPYDAGSLLPVNMTGIETTGFNQWDEQWEVGEISDQTGQNSSGGGRIRAKNFIPCFANTSYYLQSSLSTNDLRLYYYDANKSFIGHTGWLTNGAITTPTGCRYMRFATGGAYGTTYNNDICINISDPTRNGTYEPYWQQTRTIPAGTLRSAGSVYDELTETERITRVGERVYQGGDESDATVTTDGTTTHYPLTIPTVTPIDPPLNLTYRTEQGGTERVMVPAGENSAPPTIVAAQGYTAESLRDAALSAIAPVENGKASTNYAVGSYLVHGGQLCKVTTAIATGEAITIGTNVTATTVMAEVIALIAQ